jgi:acetylornithine deacetylase/succinyl-diaminopimelate desuccinylase-like protein
MTLSEQLKIDKETILKDFFIFLRFPSISTDPAYKEDLLKCADWVQDQIETMGLTVDRWETTGHPTLFATFEVDPSKPTVLIYNHYDVQPVDPLELWTSPPFEPTIRDGEIYARGAQDNKGQCFYVMKALGALLERDGTLPVNIKWIIEGEEEIGSGGLSALLNGKKDLLTADYLVIADVSFNDMDHPAVTIGVRGMVTMEMEITGSNTDLHSGAHGGMVVNPNHALVEILSKLRDSSGRVLVPGFYDGIQELTPEEREAVSWEFDLDDYERMFDTKACGGEQNHSPVESAWIRPTLEINGMSGGYTGPGFKTVIPAKAHAKISCRTVPGQNPDELGQKVADYIGSVTPKGVKVEVRVSEGTGGGVRAPANSRAVEAFSQAYTEVLQKPCGKILLGGSIPICGDLAAACGGELVLMGYGLPDDQIHAPDEHFGVDRLEKGLFTFARALEILGS